MKKQKGEANRKRRVSNEGGKGIPPAIAQRRGPYVLIASELVTLPTSAPVLARIWSPSRLLLLSLLVCSRYVSPRVPMGMRNQSQNDPPPGGSSCSSVCGS